DGKVRLLDARTGRLARRLDHPWAHSVAVTPDGKKALSTGWSGEGTVRLWDLETGKELKRFGPYGTSVGGVAVSSDGKRLLFGCYPRTARLLDFETGKELQRFARRGQAGPAAPGAHRRALPPGLLGRRPSPRLGRLRRHDPAVGRPHGQGIDPLRGGVQLRLRCRFLPRRPAPRHLRLGPLRPRLA